MKQLVETLSVVMSLYNELDLGNTVLESSRTNLEDYVYDDQSEESEEDSDSDSKGDEGAETKIVQDTKASEKDESAQKEYSEEEDNGDKTETQRSESGAAESNYTKEKERASLSRRKDTGQNSSVSVISCCSLREEAVALYLLVNLGNEEAIMNVLNFPQNVK